MTQLALQLPAMNEAEQVQGSPDSKKVEGKDSGTAAGKTLADFEKEAFEALQSKRQPKSKEPKTKKDPNSKLTKEDGKKSKGNQKTMKKPAAAVAQVLGCIRCRGNTNGCESCRSPSFKGLRLPGRAAWLAWHEEHGEAKKSKK